jgi:multiple sugar transport system substrate-binding protein
LKRRSVVIFLTAFLVLTFIAAFTPNFASILYSRELSILLWTDSYGVLEKNMKPVLFTFQRLTGVRVVAETASYNELYDKIVNAWTIGKPWDLMAIDNSWIAEFVSARWLAPVNKYFTTETKENLVRAPIEGATYNGSTYGFPYFADIHTFYYNTEILRAAGIEKPPRTWDEFVQDSLLIKEKGLCKYPVAWSWQKGGPLSRDFFTMLCSFGGKITEQGNFENGKLYFADEAGLGALNFMIDTITKYSIADPASLTYREEDVLDLFSAGKTAFWLNCPFAPPILENKEKSKVVGQWKASLTPGLRPEMSGSIVYSMSYAIASVSKLKDVAWKLITLISGPKIQLKMVESQWIPTYKSVFNETEAVRLNSALPIMLEQIEYATPKPNFAWWNEFSLMVETEIQKALNAEQTAEETLENCVYAAKNIRTQD